MAVKFLDNTGLGYFWSKIKAWCNATFAAITHNHASNAVNAMTGYSKPNSGSAIATSDSLNSAIGKLEAKVDAVDDSNYVHLTGNETITGSKDFKENYNKTLHLSMQKGVTPSNNLYGGWLYYDKDNNGLGYVEFSQRTDSSYDIKLGCYRQSESGNVVGPHIYAGVDSNGIEYLNGTYTSDQRAGDGDILTRNWIPKDTRIVHTTGNETISGLKYFKNRLFRKSSAGVNYGLSLVDEAATKGTAPSSARYFGIDCYCSDSDSYTNRIGMFECRYNTDRTSVAGMYAYKCDSATNSTAECIAVYYPVSGNPYTSAPTPATSDNSTKIATTAFVKAQGYLTSHQSLDSCVKTSGAQTIAGVKTFSSDLIITNSNPLLKLKHSSYVHGTTPSSTVYWWLEAYDKNGLFIGAHSLFVSNGKNACAYMTIKDHNSTNSIQVALYYESNGNKFFRPEHDNSYYLGGSSYRWKQLYAGTTTIATSDKRHKDFIEDIPNSVLDSWESVEWKQFKMDDAISEKGSNKARLHTGLIAQDIKDIFVNNNLDISSYGLFCYDEWDYLPAVTSETGRVISEERKAGNIYSIRYEEALCMEAAYQRRKNKILENRISELERQVSDMLQTLQSLKGAN